LGQGTEGSNHFHCGPYRRRSSDSGAAKIRSLERPEPTVLGHLEIQLTSGFGEKVIEVGVWTATAICMTVSLLISFLGWPPVRNVLAQVVFFLIASVIGFSVSVF
jgi:hypothetical protein